MCGFGVWPWSVALECGFGVWPWSVALECGTGVDFAVERTNVHPIRTTHVYVENTLACTSQCFMNGDECITHLLRGSFEGPQTHEMASMPSVSYMEHISTEQLVQKNSR